MERQSANAVDERINRLVKSLREAPMPNEPSDFARPQRRAPMRLSLVALAALATGAAVVATLVAPRESAASALQHLIRAGIDVPIHTQTYIVDPGKAPQLLSEAYVFGNRAKVISGDRQTETLISDRVQCDYHAKTRSAVMTHIDFKPEAWLGQVSLSRLLYFREGAEVVRDRAVPFRGKLLDRFHISGHLTDALGQTLRYQETLYADPANDRPHHLESFMVGGSRGQFVHGQRCITDWTYPDPKSVDLSMQLPPGTAVYDEASMRKAVKEQVTRTLGVDLVEGIRVTLRAVYANENGGIEVFTTGGTGRIERAPQGLRVDGQEAAETFSAGQNQGHWAGGDFAHGGQYVFDPLRYRGLDLIFQSAGWAKLVVPRVIDLEVPVWKADQSRLGRHFVGYARFANVVPIRYDGYILQDRMNRSILAPTDAPAEGSAAEPSEEGG